MKRLYSFVLFFLLSSSVFADYAKISKAVQTFVKVGTASGVITRSWEDKDGKFWSYVLTGYHVVDNYRENQIPGDFYEFSKQGEIIKTTRVTGIVVNKHPERDFAIVGYNTYKYFDAADLIEESYSNEYGIFDEVYAVGGPNRQKIWATKGIISSINVNPSLPGYLGHDAKIHFGSSGGPLYNSEMKVIGINLNLSNHYFRGTFERIDIPLNYIGYSLPISIVYQTLSKEDKILYFNM